MRITPPKVEIKVVKKLRAHILDDERRTVDASGKEVELTHRSLERTFRSFESYFDQRVSITSAQRLRMGFKFHNKGRFVKIAQRIGREYLPKSFCTKFVFLLPIPVPLLMETLSGHTKRGNFVLKRL